MGWTAGPEFAEPVCLLLQCRGLPYYQGWLADAHEDLIFAGESLPSGVIHIVLADRNLVPLSERLVFNMNPQDMMQLSLHTERPFYGSRENVRASFTLSADCGQYPVGGNFSVSVTDDRYVDTEGPDNILSNLLLTSELKGFIEDPAYYFRDQNSMTLACLDILMMTQGWSRYDVGSVLQGDLQYPRGHLELGPTLSGTVTGGLLMNRRVSDFPVSVIATGDTFYMDRAVTDIHGKFVFNLPELPEGTPLLVQAKTLKNSDRAELLLDPEDLPVPCFSVPHPSSADRSAEDFYMRRAEEKYLYENGARMVLLDEITVRARAVSPVRHSSYPADGISVQSIGGEKLEHYRTMRTALSMMGVHFVGNSYSIRGGGEPLFQVDGVETDASTVDILMMDDVAEIAVIKDAMAGSLYGLKGGNGAVLISTRHGFDQTLRKREIFNMKTVTPLGYLPVKEFYSPRYETPGQRRDGEPDLRTTIYWNPNFATDPSGSAEIDFYTADSIDSYTVIIEGVTDDGKPLRLEQKIYGTR